MSFVDEYMDLVGLRILEAERDIAVNQRVRAASMFPATFALACQDAAMLDLRLVAYERWLLSNSFEVRHLPHVARERDRLNGRPLDGSDRMLSEAVEVRRVDDGSRVSLSMSLTEAAARDRRFKRGT